MKFTCLQENFNRALSNVSKAVAQRGSLPVLSNILLEAEKGRVRVSATNLETGIVTWVGAKVKKQGSITVPARFLSEFIANLPSSQIECELNGLILTISAENAKSKFNGLDASEFPTLATGIKNETLKINPKIFFKAVSESYFSAATEDSRPILTGVLINAEQNNLTLVGVDGFRLSERKINLPKKVENDFSAVVYGRTLMGAAKLLLTSEEDVSVELNKKENSIIFKGTDILVSSRLLEGDFPDYKKIIPAAGSVKFNVSVESIINAVKLAQVFSKDGSNIVRLKINPGENLLIVSSEAEEFGENETRVEIEDAGGEELNTSFNGRYLSELLSNIKADQLEISTSGSLNPALFKIVGRTDFIHIIMPVRVQE